MEYEESIYNLIPKERYEPPKPDRYKSKHAHNVAPTASTFCLKTTSKPGCSNLNGDQQPEGGSHSHKGDGLTFGKPKGTLKPDSTNFRKKGTGTMQLPECKSNTKIMHRVSSLAMVIIVPWPEYSLTVYSINIQERSREEASCT